MRVTLEHGLGLDAGGAAASSGKSGSGTSGPGTSGTLGPGKSGTLSSGTAAARESSDASASSGPFRTVYLGLGSNLGDRAAAIAAALRALAGRRTLRHMCVSRIYQTDAVAPDPQPPYLNAVVRGETNLAAGAVLADCMAIEDLLGRVRPLARPKAPRTIDIDLLLCGAEVIDTHELKVPHPALLERAFVLIPLADVALPGLVHPITGIALTIAAPSPTVRRRR